MASDDTDDTMHRPMQTRVTIADEAKIREAMDADRKRPTEWIRDVLIAVSAMDSDARQALLEGPR